MGLGMPRVGLGAIALALTRQLAPLTARPCARLGLIAVPFLSLILTACSELGETARYRQDLAIHLSVSGAKMYGAHWCPHCATQKELFGAAAEQIPYVECDPAGENSQTALCQQKGIQAYPTWEINGEFRQGVHPLGKLADLTEFPPPPPGWFEQTNGGGSSPAAF